MSDKVVKLAEARPAQKEINADAIELAEALLERLKSGKAVAVAIAEVVDDGGVMTAWSNTDRHFHALTAAAARLLSRMAQD